MSRRGDFTVRKEISREELIGWIYMATGVPGLEITQEEFSRWLGLLMLRQPLETELKEDLAMGVGLLWFFDFIPNKVHVNIRRKSRPTDSQWFYLFRYFCLAGFVDIESREVRRFIKRVAKVESPRFLTRAGAAKVIAKQA